MSVKGTVTATSVGAESWAVTIMAPTLSSALWLALVNCTVGCARVTVRSEERRVGKVVAFVGVLIVKMTVSLYSFTESSTTVSVMLAVVCPAGMVMGLAGRV